jgi:hypothetical protein
MTHVRAEAERNIKCVTGKIHNYFLNHKIMRFILISACIVFSLVSCGPGDNQKKAKAYQDSVYKADSLAKCIQEIESWEIFQLGINNEEGLLNKYGNKRIRIKNLVLDNIMTDHVTIQCLAYSPKDSLLSSTSIEGDKIKNLAEWVDFVNGVKCKFNPDFTYFFELHSSESLDTSLLKPRITKETLLSKKSFYKTILTVEGDSICINSNSFVLKNCTIKDSQVEK